MISALLGLRKPRRSKGINRAIEPKIDALEDRMLLYAAIGGSWVYPQRITYSLMPDGTPLEGGTGAATSNLFSTLNAKFPNVDWTPQIQRAAAIWSTVTNINLVMVSDNGMTLGTGSYQQGDPNVGDIRIGGTTSVMTSSQLAMTYKLPPSNGGSLAGDILLNDNQDWQINSNYDLQTVMIHEFGHALGLDHSAYSTAAMYATYNNIKQTVTSDDISGIQSLYSGARTSDAYEGAAPGNYNAATATNINSYLNASNNQIMLPQTNTGAYPDISTSTDNDWYKVTVPSTGTLSGSMVVQMQSAGLSSLSPRIQVYNSSLQTLALATSPNTFGSTVSVTISNVTAGQTYYVRSIAANTGATAIGVYGLTVNFGTSATNPAPIPTTTVLAQPDRGSGSSSEMIDFFSVGHHRSEDAARLAPTVRLFSLSDSSVGFDSIVYLPTVGITNFNADGSIGKLNAVDSVLNAWKTSKTRNFDTNSDA